MRDGLSGPNVVRPACPEGAAGLAYSHKLIPQTSRNSLLSEDLSSLELEELGQGARNSLPAGDFAGLGKEGASAKTKKLLVQALVNPPWKHLLRQAEPSEAISDGALERHRAFLDKHLDYLVSGDAILATEALVVMMTQLDASWPPKRQRRYQMLLREMGDALEYSKAIPLEMLERCRKWLRPNHSQ